ncbi:MAG: ribosome maturation factor RimM [Fimbriimonadaceae bacterium]|nr:ribosome maturation factor RimM [Fimbriimonadaceae bacterium]
MPQPLVRIGQIVGAFGLRGELKVEPLTDFPSRFAPGTRVRVGEQWTSIAACRWHKGRPILRLDGIISIDDAEPLKWRYLEAEQQPPELEEDEYLTRDLIGLLVVTEEGEELGPLDAVERYPAQDVLVVGQIQIPAVKAFVKSVDLVAKRIVVALVPGMRPGEADDE